MRGHVDRDPRSAAPGGLRILLVGERHEALASALAASPRCDAVGIARDPADASRQASSLMPHAVVLDGDLTARRPEWLRRAVEATPAAAVFLLTDVAGVLALDASPLARGAAGYVNRAASAAETAAGLLDAVLFALALPGPGRRSPG